MWPEFTGSVSPHKTQASVTSHTRPGKYQPVGDRQSTVWLIIVEHFVFGICMTQSGTGLLTETEPKKYTIQSDQTCVCRG